MVLGPEHVLLFVVLTLPGTFEQMGNREHDRRLFHQAVKRWRIGNEAPQVWWGKEYQRRGAVHYNFFVVVPSKYVGLFQHHVNRYMRRPSNRWGSKYTCDVFKAGHHGALVYAMKYAIKSQKSSKADQQVLPEGVEHAGRWWGVTGTSEGWVRAELSRAAFCDLRRANKAWRQSKGWKASPLSRKLGWVTIEGAPPGLLELAGVNASA